MRGAFRVRGFFGDRSILIRLLGKPPLLISLFLAAITHPFDLAAEISLPSVFSDDMVLQASQELTLWGRANPSERIQAILAESKGETVADDRGRWTLTLDPLPAGGPFELIVSGSNEVRIQNVLVGEVWICAGQSNMEFSLKDSDSANDEIARGDYPRIRLFKVGRAVAGKPQEDVSGEWRICSPDTVKDFSAIGYHFGKEVHLTQKVPVGLILTCWGGTPAEAWTEESALRSLPAQKTLIEDWNKEIASYPNRLSEYLLGIDTWLNESNVAETRGGTIPSPPGFPEDPRRNSWRPSGLYNGMVSPLIPYAIRGVIWYQGESNARRAFEYRDLFRATIQSWRGEWGLGDFPFLYVQLPVWGEIDDDPGESDWAELREAQAMALELPNTGMAVTLDLGVAEDVHPKNKGDFAHRLALLARNQVYGEKVESLSPRYASAEIVGSTARVFFKDVGEGLSIRNGEKVLGFTLAGEDRVFYFAEARIEEDQVVVWSPRVPKPMAVRYAWDHHPLFNLYGKNELPVAPFRTDSWAGRTENRVGNLFQSLKAKTLRRLSD